MLGGARREANALFIGLDANAAGMAESSRSALKALPNALFVCAPVEALPAELAGTATEIRANLPWGSLLATLAGTRPAVLRGVRCLGVPGAAFDAWISWDPERDAAELERLALPDIGSLAWAGRLVESYKSAGFAEVRVTPHGVEALDAVASSWARRLRQSRHRRVLHIEATAAH